MNKAEVISWILSNHKAMDIKINKLNWMKKWAPGFNSFSATTRFQGKDLVGLGTDECQSLALIKAVSELFERCTQVENNISTSNGMAAHIDCERARSNSISELIERDIFINQMISTGPLLPTKIELSSIPSSLMSFTKNLKTQGINVLDFTLGAYKNLTCVLTIGFDQKCRFGLSAGLGISENLTQALIQARTESMRRVSWVLETKDYTSISLKSFNKLKHPTHQDHFRLAMDPTYAHVFLSGLTKKSCNTNQIIFSKEIIQVKSKRLFLKDKKFLGHPFKVFQSSSPNLQYLPKGPFTSRNVNLGRLKSTGLKLNGRIQDLLPHPLT